MSLNAILSNAVSGLNVAQASLRNASNNVANVNTEGYARKVVEQQSHVIGGQGAGVKVAEVRRIVDDFLQRELRTVSADSARYESMSRMHDRLQTLLGDPTSDASLSAKLDQAFAALATLPTDPTSATRRASALNALQSFGNDISRVARQVQALRGEADGQVVQDLDAANGAIMRVHLLNKQIRSESIAGRDTTALDDQRDQAISELAKIVDIRTFPLSNGGVGISTISGVSLLDETARSLVYDPPGSISSSTSFPQITVNRIDPVTGAIDGTGTALDDKLRSGSLRGWLDMRDQELPDLAAELGQLAARLTDEINAVHNASTSVPPPASLTGRNSGLATTDLHGFTGQATFYVFDTDNAVAASVTIDFDALPAGATLGDVITAVNAGLGTNGTLALSNGVMSFEVGSAAGATGVAIAQDTPPSSRGGRGFSHFFGMNDLMQAAVEAHHDSGLTSASVHGFTGETTIELRGPNNEIAGQYTLDFSAPPLSNAGSTMADVVSAINGAGALGNYATASLDADGALVIVPNAAYADYSVAVPTDGSDRAGTGATFSSMFGLGRRYEADAALDLAVRSDITADPARMALAQVDAAGTPALTASDGRGALELQALAQATVGFAAAGGMPSLSATLGNYAAQLLGAAGRDASHVESLRDDRMALESELANRVDSVSGVNLDEELASMIALQNAYNAAARMITTAREMYDVLLQL